MEKWFRLPTIAQPFIFLRSSSFAKVSSFHQGSFTGFRYHYSSLRTSNDYVRDIYIKELKSYRPTQEKPGAESGLVKELRLPPAPPPPNVSEDLSEELAAYDAEDLHHETEISFGSSFEDQILKDEEEAPSHGH